MMKTIMLAVLAVMSVNSRGLAITKKIIESEGGSIWLESEEGKGSTFYFTVLKK